MNRYTNGKHQNNANKRVKKTNRIVNNNRLRIAMMRTKNSSVQKSKAKHSSNKKMTLTTKSFRAVCIIILCMLIFAVTSNKEIAAYFTDLKSITNIFSINAEYTISFNSNTGSGSMGNQTISYNVTTALNSNSFTKTGYSFVGWNTDAGGAGTSYTNGQSVTNIGNTILYAQWEKNPVKYAVQIYGINQDEDALGNKLGLTFGPALGANYNNSYITHTYEETSSGSGEYYVKIVTHTVDAFGNETTSEDYLYKDGGTTTKVTRTTAEKNKYDINMHEMTWTQIQAVSDKTAFLDCMLCGDTKSVSLTLNSTLATSNVYNQYGDGAGMLYNTVNIYYRIWNPSKADNSYVGTGVTLDSNERSYGSNAKKAGGYSASHIRATLVGKDSKINEGYAGNVNLDTTNSIYSCIESDLQNVITAKKIKYVTGINNTYGNYSLNDDISDKIWLFSNRELYGNTSELKAEGIGTSGGGYNKFGNNESKFYISSYSNNNTVTSRVGYSEAGSSLYWWHRSLYLENTYKVRGVYPNGDLSTTYNVNDTINGLAFGFCIDNSPVNYIIRYYGNTGSGTMANQQMVSNVPAALTANAFTKTGYTFKEWNTSADGSGTSYTNGQVVSRLSSTEGAVINLYAQWEKNPTKYAVQIYGINQDEDAAGNKLGLTFGPATGDDYNNKYVTHTYEETSSGSGLYYVKIVTHTVDAYGNETTSEDYLYKDGGTTDKVTRTMAEKNKYDINMHEMTWSEIQAVSDKTGFLDCMLCGDTKSIVLTINSTLETSTRYNQYGDGAGMLNACIKDYYKKWNPRSSENSYIGTGVTLSSSEQSYGSNARNDGGYASSHIRATLVGKDSKTNEGYAGDVNLDTSNSLYSCIESDLQNVITAKKVKYVTGSSYTSGNYNLNEDIADKIWLFSQREVYGTGQYTGGITEGIGTSGDGYDKFENNESKYYISSYNNSADINRVSYSDGGGVYYWWLRSPGLNYTFEASRVFNDGNINAFDFVHFHYGISFGFCIDSSPVNYSVKFNANTGSGTMANQPMISNVPAPLTANAFTKTGYTFKGWNTQANGTGTDYTNGQVVSKLSNTEGAVVNLYAQWEKAPTKYAVQIYGINQDEDSDGNKLGLTFGPATGANYNNAYVTHTYEETSSGSGVYYVKIVTHTVNAFGGETTTEEYLFKDGEKTNKVTRTLAEKNKYDINMHEMTWTEIAAVSDKTAFLDCMLCGDTKSVILTLNSTLATSNLYDQYGDGAGMLRGSINDYYKKWNPNKSDNSFVGTGVTLDSHEQSEGSSSRNTGGYAVSHMRATLVGKDSKTNEGYAGNVNLNSTNSLFTCIESDLRNVITAKKVKYVTGTSESNYNLNDDISDKIWLFSSRELYGTGDANGFTTEGIGIGGEGYNKYGNNESKYYISSYNDDNLNKRIGYNEAGSNTLLWLRSPRLYNKYHVNVISKTSGLDHFNGAYNTNGIAFGFCID